MMGVKIVLGRLKGEDTLTTQTVVFDKEEWSEADAKEWLKDHDLKASKVDETDDSFRFRQRDPGDFESGSFRTITPGKNAKHATNSAIIEQLRDGKRYKLTDVPVLRVGEWNGDKYSIDDLDGMVMAFKEVGYLPPVKLGHSEDTDAPAYGWVTALRRKGDVLLADLSDLPLTVFDAIRERRYDTVSAEVFFELRRNGRKYRRALRAVSLLGSMTPAVDLPPLREHFADDFAGRLQDGDVARVYHVTTENLMDKDKDKDDPRATEVATLAATLADLTSKIEKLAQDDDGKKTPGADIANIQSMVVALTKQVATLTSSDAFGVGKLQEELKAVQTELASTRVRERDAMIESKVMNLRIPVLREHFRSLYGLAFDASTVGKTVKLSVMVNNEKKLADVSPEKLVDDMADRLNKHSARLFEELSTAGDLRRDDQPLTDNPGQDVDKLTRAYMVTNKVADYGAAMTAVLADPENRELRTRYLNPSAKGG